MTFTKSDSFNRHKTVHGMKPYSCNTCGKTFLTKSYLTVHKRIHTGEKPYTCDTCNKTFVRNAELTVHKWTHTGEKPYSCDTCGKRFRTTNTLFVKHRRQTERKIYTCFTCEKTSQQKSSWNLVTPSASTSFVDCGEAYIKLEIKEEQNNDEDPISTKMESAEVIIKEEEGIESEEFV